MVVTDASFYEGLAITAILLLVNVFVFVWIRYKHWVLKKNKPIIIKEKKNIGTNKFYIDSHLNHTTTTTTSLGMSGNHKRIIILEQAVLVNGIVIGINWIEILFALLFCIYPEINLYLFGNPNINSFYTRLLACLILAINGCALYCEWLTTILRKEEAGTSGAWQLWHKPLLIAMALSMVKTLYYGSSLFIVYGFIIWESAYLGYTLSIGFWVFFALTILVLFISLLRTMSLYKTVNMFIKNTNE